MKIKKQIKTNKQTNKQKQIKTNKPAWNCWWSPRTEREEGWSIVLPTSLTGVRAVRGVNVLPINKQNKKNISVQKNKTNKNKQKQNKRGV